MQENMEIMHKSDSPTSSHGCAGNFGECVKCFFKTCHITPKVTADGVEWQRNG